MQGKEVSLQTIEKNAQGNYLVDSKHGFLEHFFYEIKRGEYNNIDRLRTADGGNVFHVVAEYASRCDNEFFPGFIYYFKELTILLVDTYQVDINFKNLHEETALVWLSRQAHEKKAVTYCMVLFAMLGAEFVPEVTKNKQLMSSFLIDAYVEYSPILERSLLLKMLPMREAFSGNKYLKYQQHAQKYWPSYMVQLMKTRDEKRDTTSLPDSFDNSLRVNKMLFKPFPFSWDAQPMNKGIIATAAKHLLHPPPAAPKSPVPAAAASAEDSWHKVERRRR